jgi:hypothetical protein
VRLASPGDRIVHIEDRGGRVATARTRAQLLGHQGSLDPAGEPRVDDRVWTEASVLADVERIVGPHARLVRGETAARFDILPLLVATDGAISAFGYDGRRLRPNLVIGGVPGAELFFPKFGFTRIPRGVVPETVQTSVEFTSACPSKATVMMKTLSAA